MVRMLELWLLAGLTCDAVDMMETWDEAKLRNVVDQNETKQRTTTDVSWNEDCLDRADEFRSCANFSFRPLRRRSTDGCE